MADSGFSFPSIRDEHLIAVGHVTLQWSYLEGQINDGISYVSWFTGKFPAAVESTSPFNQRLTYWRKEACAARPDLQMDGEIERLCSKADNLHQKRSQLLHYLCWMENPLSVDAHIRPTWINKPPGRTKMASSPEAITKLAAEISDLNVKISQFYGKTNWYFWSTSP